MTILSYLTPWSNLWNVTPENDQVSSAWTWGHHHHSFSTESPFEGWNPTDIHPQPVHYGQNVYEEPYGWPIDYIYSDFDTDADSDDDQWYHNMNNSSSNITLRKRRHTNQAHTPSVSWRPDSDQTSEVIDIDDVEPASGRRESKRQKVLKTCRFSDDVEILSDEDCFENRCSSGVDSDCKLLSIENGENLINETSSYSVYNYLKVLLSSSERQIDAIKGDGNCFFRALSKAMYGNQKYHDKIRQAVVDLIEKFPAKFEAFTDGPLKYHIEDMRQDKTWATQTEIYAAATLLRTSIYVLSPDATGDTYRWLLFTPQFKFISKTITRQCSCYITLCHTHGNHYDRVAPLGGECNCDVDPPEMSGVQGSVDLTDDVEIV